MRKPRHQKAKAHPKPHSWKWQQQNGNPGSLAPGPAIHPLPSRRCYWWPTESLGVMPAAEGSHLCCLWKLPLATGRYPALPCHPHTGPKQPQVSAHTSTVVGSSRVKPSLKPSSSTRSGSQWHMGQRRLRTAEARSQTTRFQRSPVPKGRAPCSWPPRWRTPWPTTCSTSRGSVRAAGACRWHGSGLGTHSCPRSCRMGRTLTWKRPPKYRAPPVKTLPKATLRVSSALS